MRLLAKIFSLTAILALVAPAATPKSPKSPAADEGRTMVIVFKDGHQQTYRMDEITRIEFSSPVAATAMGSAHFMGVWRVGMGGGSSETFLIKLKSNGVAEKSTGDDRGGTWSVVGGEARCRWNDGWTDVIRKVGGRWVKDAYEAGRSLDEPPSNTAAAVYTEPN